MFGEEEEASLSPAAASDMASARTGVIEQMWATSGSRPAPPKEAWTRPASRVRAGGARPTPPQSQAPTWAGRLRQKRDAEIRRERAEQKNNASWQMLKDAFDVVADHNASTLDDTGLASLLELLDRPMQPEQLRVAMQLMRAGPDGRVGLDGFAAWYIRAEKQDKLDEVKRIRAAFDLLDRDGSGALDKSEVAMLSQRLGTRLKTVYSSKLLNAAFSEMDPNGDGRVTFEEFRGWWMQKRAQEKAEQARVLAEKLALDAAQRGARASDGETVLEEGRGRRKGKSGRCTARVRDAWADFSPITCVSCIQQSLPALMLALFCGFD